MNSKSILDSTLYSFDASAQTITFWNHIHSQDEVLLITNISGGNQIIYNFACPEHGGILGDHILTLVYDTTNMSDNDTLLIVIRDRVDNKETLLESIDSKNIDRNDILSSLISEEALYNFIDKLARANASYAANVIGDATSSSNSSSSNIASKSAILSASLGLIPGVYPVNKYGQSPDGVQTSATDIWSRANAAVLQQIWLAPTGSRVHTIASTSAQDTTGGTGVDTVVVSYLPSWDTKEREETVIGDLNAGIVMENSAVIIHRMKVINQATSLNNNVGTITATAAVDATVTAVILPTEGQTQMAIYGIPSSQRFAMTKFDFAIHDQTGADVKVHMVVNTNPDVQTTNFIIKDNIGATDDGTSAPIQSFNPYYMIEGPAIIKLQGEASKNDVDCSATFDGYLVDKEFN